MNPEDYNVQAEADSILESLDRLSLEELVLQRHLLLAALVDLDNELLAEFNRLDDRLPREVAIDRLVESYQRALLKPSAAWPSEPLWDGL